MKSLLKGMLVAGALSVAVILPANISDAKIKVSKVTVKSNYGSSVHVAKGKKVKLTATVKVSPNKAANKGVIYTSSNKKIATVSSTGVVKGIKTGSCKITVKSRKNTKKKATIKVYVVKKVTSVKLSADSKEVYAGEKLTLKATVAPATGSYKKVTYTTSDKKIATVNSSGVVTGVAAGTATITATSVEGTAKKGTFKVKVLSKDAINIESVQVLADDCIEVNLNKVKTLTADKFVIKGKIFAKGKYNKTYHIRKIRNYDNKKYHVYVDTENAIKENEYIQVSIDSLPGNGTKTKEVQNAIAYPFEPKDEYWVGNVGDKVDTTVSLSRYCNGSVEYKVTGGVVGVTYKQVGDSLEFSGEYGVASADGKIEITATDELDHAVKMTIYVLVGNENKIVATTEPVTYMTDIAVKKQPFKVAGGSGKYVYSCNSLPEGLEISESGIITGIPKVAGEYSVPVLIADKKDTKLSTTVTAKINIEAPKKFIGLVKDKEGKALENVKVIAANLETFEVYDVNTNESGYYSIDVPAGTYVIMTQYDNKNNNRDAVYYVTITSGSRQFDFDFENV